MTFFRAGLGLAAVLAAFSVACSDGSDEPPTAEEAAAIVAAGLLEEADLPEATWTVEDTDLSTSPDGEGEDDDLMTAESCATVNALFDEIEGSSGSSLADVEREFTTGDEAQFQQTSITSNVFVPDPEIDLEATFEDIREAFAIDAIRPCFEESLPELFGGEEAGITVTSVTVTEATHVAEEGIGIAVDLDAVALIIPLVLHLEMHMWPSGDAVGSLMLLDLNSDLVSENSAAIVEAAEQKLADAVEAN